MLLVPDLGRGLKNSCSGSWVLWLMPVFLASWEEEFRKIVVGGSLGKKFTKPPSQPIKAGW
jgi:hypothetical protein